MRANFNSYSTSCLFKRVGKELGVSLNTNCQETRFSIPAGAGEGTVSHFRFSDGLSNFVFDGKLKQDWVWEFQCDDTSPLYIFFLLNGNLADIRPNDERQFELEPMQTLIVVEPGGNAARSIVFKAGERIKVSVVSIRKDEFLQHKGCGLTDLPPELQLLLSVKNKEVRALFPPDRTSLDTSIIVQEIIDCPHQGLMRNCFVEAKTRELLWLSLKRKGADTLDPASAMYLKSIALKEILKARSILVENLKDAPTIEELAKQVGLNRQRLKVDFKATFGKTIYQYLREERMKTAKSLLMKKRTTVQEVAAAVGYENASHFSRRFYEQFGILPSKFSAMIWRKGQDN